MPKEPEIGPIPRTEFKIVVQPGTACDFAINIDFEDGEQVGGFQFTQDDGDFNIVFTVNEFDDRTQWTSETTQIEDVYAMTDLPSY